MLDASNFIAIAHQSRVEVRNKDFDRANHELKLDTFQNPVKNMLLGTNSQVHEDLNKTKRRLADRYQYVFWFGDLNYRIDGPLDKVKELVTNKQFEQLLDMDQLRREMAFGTIFQGFEEASIHFQPTYKFNSVTPGSSLARTSTNFSSSPFKLVVPNGDASDASSSTHEGDVNKRLSSFSQYRLTFGSRKSNGSQQSVSPTSAKSFQFGNSKYQVHPEPINMQMTVSPTEIEGQPSESPTSAVASVVSDKEDDVGSPYLTYSHSKHRIPSYTDRILFKTMIPDSVHAELYDSCMKVTSSDHKPVYGMYRLNHLLKINT